MTLHAETTKNRNGMLSLGILLVSTPVCVFVCTQRCDAESHWDGLLWTLLRYYLLFDA